MGFKEIEVSSIRCSLIYLTFWIKKTVQSFSGVSDEPSGNRRDKRQTNDDRFQNDRIIAPENQR